MLRRSGGPADAAASLVLANHGTRALRADGVVVGYWRDAERLRLDSLTSSVLSEGAGARPRIVEAGARVEWAGICLDDPPPSADRARVEVAFSWRHGLVRRRARAAADLALVAAPEPRQLVLPFEGYWLVTQGHACGTNHRLGGFGGEFAWDFVHIEPPPDPGREARNREDPTFGRAVLAPAGGRVVRVVGDVPDNEGLEDYPRRSVVDELREPEWIFGNFVVLESGGGAFVLLAHLERGSVAVAPGDEVRAGQAIARCGNSGNSVRPHLHVQVMDRADPSEAGVRGVPAVLSGYREITVSGSAERRDILARRVSVGDPPEGAILSPLDDPVSAP